MGILIVCVARVSKLKGLRRSVIGSSFITSTNTNKPPAIKNGNNKGKVTFIVVPKKVFPRHLLAENKF